MGRLEFIALNISVSGLVSRFLELGECELKLVCTVVVISGFSSRYVWLSRPVFTIETGLSDKNGCSAQNDLPFEGSLPC